MCGQKPLIIYHRGRHGRGIRIKENTLLAFERAIKEGAVMIEFDVQGDLKVAHDPNPDSSAPTLWGVMDVLRARTKVNIEIKSPKGVPELLEVIEDAITMGCWTANQIVVSSFHHETAIRVKKVFPEIAVGVVNRGVLAPAYVNWLARESVDNLHVEWLDIIMDIENGHRMRDAALANNMQIWAWTVNTKVIFDTVVEYGAEAIFTDKPQLFR